MQGYSDLKPKALATIEIKGVAIVPVSESFSVTPSLGYSGKGKQYRSIEMTDEMGNSLGNGDIHYLFNYFELAVPASYKLISQNGIEYYLGAGPYVGYAFSGKNKLKNVSLPSGDQSTNIFPSDYYNRMDAGLVLELTARFNKNFLVAFNLDIGLTNVTKSSSYIRNQAGGLSIGYLFGGN
jgi:hypothetical protein